MQEFNEGDGIFLQTPVPIPPPPPIVTPTPTVEATPATEAAGKTAGEPEPTPTPTQQPPEQPSPVPTPEPMASPTPEPTIGPTAVPTPTATATPVPTPLAVPTPRPTSRPPVIISNDTQPLPALPVDCLSEFQPTPPDIRGQTLPHVFAGTVSVDGAIAPDGSVVTARIEGLLAAVAVLKGGNYTLAVEPPPGVSYIGKKSSLALESARPLQPLPGKPPESTGWTSPPGLPSKPATSGPSNSRSHQTVDRITRWLTMSHTKSAPNHHFAGPCPWFIHEPGSSGSPATFGGLHDYQV